MANFKKKAIWHEGVHQLSRTDPVVGGEGGVSNKAPEQLADRTEWLKERIEGLNDAITAPDGYRVVGQVESIAELRTIEPVEPNQHILVRSYYEGKNVGGGTFYYDAKDTTSADNGGTVIVTAGGMRWKRIYQTITPFDFGAVGDGVTNDELAFAKIEAVIVNHPIDLCNKTYVVDNVKTKNQYFNGWFNGNGLNGLTIYDAPYQMLKSGNGVVRINGGNKIPDNYKKEKDQFNVCEAVIAIGSGALANATGAGQTIAIGGNALGKAQKSYSNIAIGETALEHLQSSGSVYSTGDKGSRNIAIGGNALQFLHSGVRNVAIGRNAGCGVENAWDCTLIGAGAMSGMNANGWYADVESQLGNKNADAKVTTVGTNSLQLYNGKFASALGTQAGANLKVGDANTFVGYRAAMSLEADVGWDGLVKTTYGDSNGLQVDYVKNGNQLIVNLDNHQCVVGGTAHIKWDSGPAFPNPAHWHAWRQEIIAVTQNQITFYCPYNTADGQGKATIYWSLSNVKDTATSRHNTVIGHTAAWRTKQANNSVMLGSLVGALAHSINNSTLVGFSTAVNATNITNSVLIGASAAKEIDGDINGLLAIGNTITGNENERRIGVNIPITQNPLANLHIRAKGNAGSGRTAAVDGLLIESATSATAYIDGINTANIDFQQSGITKAAFRYSHQGGLMSMLLGGSPVWRFTDSGVFYPNTDAANIIGSATRRLKELHVVTPNKSDKSTKTPTTEWVYNLFEQGLTSTGWQKLPSGLIIQWGGADSGTFSFPIAFNECFLVIPIDYSEGITRSISVRSVTNTTATVNLGDAGYFKYLAIGR